MEMQTNPIPSVQTAEKKARTTYTFREITEANELEQAFRLRYEVYSKSRVRSMLRQNENEIDIDVFDLHSNHYGLFANENELIGYLRVVLDKTKFYNSTVFEIGKKYNLFNSLEHCLEGIQKVVDYPFLSYPNIPGSVISHYESLKSQNEEFAEGSRLIIKENFRGIRTSSFLIECIMVLFMFICLGKRIALLSCCKDHSPFYKRYGFKPLGNGEEYKIYDVENEGLTLYLSTLPANLPSRFEEMKAQYLITGKITKSL